MPLADLGDQHPADLGRSDWFDFVPVIELAVIIAVAAFLILTRTAARGADPDFAAFAPAPAFDAFGPAPPALVRWQWWDARGNTWYTWEPAAPPTPMPAPAPGPAPTATLVRPATRGGTDCPA